MKKKSSIVPLLSNHKLQLRRETLFCFLNPNSQKTYEYFFQFLSSSFVPTRARQIFISQWFNYFFCIVSFGWTIDQELFFKWKINFFLWFDFDIVIIKCSRILLMLSTFLHFYGVFVFRVVFLYGSSGSELWGFFENSVFFDKFIFKN